MEKNCASRRYPLGIQTFSRIIEGGYVYIDKTDLVWEMAHISPFVFLSRPRRFGKSLLSSTLHSYFAGEKDLFKGLKIIDLEKDWENYPVIHLDLSTAKNQSTPDELRHALSLLLEPMTKLWGKNESEMLPGQILKGLIQRANEKTGKQVVIIIDEYDAPLLDVLHETQRLPEFRAVMQEFYQPLKASESMVKFCFITGITKFSQLSIFSTINNIKNITLLPKFATLCGITHTELTTAMAEDIRVMAESYKCEPEKMADMLKQQYNGYHFAEDSDGVYNPYSLMNAFSDKKLGNYWFESGTPTFLIRQMQHFHTDITALEDMEVPSLAFDRPTEAMENALPLLYQSGYLTIKNYDHLTQLYTLSIPNQEVRIGFADGLMPTYIGMEGWRVQTGFALKFWQALRKDDLNLALEEMKAYLAGLPYVEGFKKKLEEVSNTEGFYEWTFYLIFTMINIYTNTQVKCANGKADVVVQMPDTVYVMELKLNRTAKEALNQINTKGYAIPYQLGGRRIVKAGINFSSETKTLTDWIIEYS